jgi:hypothetical protein
VNPGSGIVLQVRVGEFLGWANESFFGTRKNLKYVYMSNYGFNGSVKKAYAMNKVKEEQDPSQDEAKEETNQV